MYEFKIHFGFLTFPDSELWRCCFSWCEIEIIYVAFVSHEFIPFLIVILVLVWSVSPPESNSIVCYQSCVALPLIIALFYQRS